MLQDAESQVCYVQHLMNMSQRFSITISDNVCNRQGAVLIPKGEHLDDNLVEKISHHQLEKPLENCVYLHDQLSAQQLMSFYNIIFSKHNNFSLFHKNSDLEEALMAGCEYYEQFPLIKQKMTVLKIQMPQRFKQSLFCAYFSLAIAQKMNDENINLAEVFLAGLIHNIGMLHMDTRVLTEKGDYNAQQWHTMHSHVSIAHEILQQVPSLPNDVATAVLEHHERFDGSGYPFATKGPNLGLMGQVVGMADTCLSLYKRDLSSHKLGFDALLPVLNLNKNLFNPLVFNAIESIINDIDWSVQRICANEDMPTLISGIMLDNECIRFDYAMIEKLIECIRPHLFFNSEARMLNNMFNRLQCSLISSGILKNEHIEWMVISFGAQQNEDYLVIERLPITYNEIKWQIAQLKHLFRLMCEKHQLKSSQFESTVNNGLWEMEQYEKQHTLPAIH